MKSLGEVLTLAVNFLKEQKIDRSRRMAEELLSPIVQLDRLDLYMCFDRPLDDKELETYRASLRRLIKGEPLEYILGKVKFYNCTFKITPAVLIPRQETEILLSKICEQLGALDLKEKICWDVCCGSGILGISIKKALPDLEVTLSDISREALALAKENARINEVEVSCVEGDLLTPFKGQKSDFIFCNPPYVSESEYAVLDKGVRDFEPRRALVGGKSGLEFYERLAGELPNYLNPHGRVFLEIGAEQGRGVEALFGASYWKTKVLEKDWAGHDRFFFLEIE